MHNFYVIQINGLSSMGSQCSMEFGVSLAYCSQKGGMNSGKKNARQPVNCCCAGGLIQYDTFTKDKSADAAKCSEWFISAVQLGSSFFSMVRTGEATQLSYTCNAAEVKKCKLKRKAKKAKRRQGGGQEASLDEVDDDLADELGVGGKGGFLASTESFTLSSNQGG